MLYFKSLNINPVTHIQSGNLLSGDSFKHSNRCLTHFVLLVGLEGTLFISQDDKEYALHPGEFMVLLPGHHHKGYRSSEGRLSYFWAHFTLNNDYQEMDNESVEQYLQGIGVTGQNKDIYLLPTHGRHTNHSRITLEFRQLIDFSMQHDLTSTISDFALSVLLMDLTHEFLQQSQQSISANRSLSSMVDLQEHIRLHFNEDLSVSKLADLFGYNANYLSTVYKKATGNSLVHYINQTRVAAAKVLLLDTNASITAIAEQVGYNDSKYFIRVFRQFEGVTPLMYRNAYYHKYINIE